MNQLKNDSEILAVTASSFIGATQQADGFVVGEIELGDKLILLTENSRYEFIITNPEERSAIVQDANRFPEGALCTIMGATLGGNMLQLGSVKVGMRLEFYVENQRYITSWVENLWIEVEPEYQN